MVCMCSSLLQLNVGSRDLSQVRIKGMLCQAEQIKKITLKIVLDEQSCHFECKQFANLLSFS